MRCFTQGRDSSGLTPAGVGAVWSVVTAELGAAPRATCARRSWKSGPPAGRRRASRSAGIRNIGAERGAIRQGCGAPGSLPPTKGRAGFDLVPGDGAAARFAGAVGEAVEQARGDAGADEMRDLAAKRADLLDKPRRDELEAV